MGSRELLQPQGLPAPLGQYSHVSRVAAGQLVYVAGQVAVDEHGDLVGEGDLGAQVRQVFHNLERALSSAGAGLGDVTKYTTFLTRVEDLESFREIRHELFTELYPHGDYPPNTLVVVTRLVSPTYLVEIEAVAATS